MRVTTLALLLLVVGGMPQAATGGQAPASAAATAPKPGTIRGRIAATDSDKPLRRSRVILLPAVQNADFRSLPRAYTNAGGQYELLGVPPGTYYVFASRTGFVGRQFGQRHPGDKGVVVEVRSGSTVDHIDIGLPRGAVLAGTVVDDAGEPFPGVSVDVLTFHCDRGRRVPSQVGGAETDDVGRFRISGLAPGQYVLVASSSETWHGERHEAYGFASSAYPDGPMDRTEPLTLAASEVGVVSTWLCRPVGRCGWRAASCWRAVGPHPEKA